MPQFNHMKRAFGLAAITATSSVAPKGNNRIVSEEAVEKYGYDIDEEDDVLAGYDETRQPDQSSPQQDTKNDQNTEETQRVDMNLPFPGEHVACEETDAFNDDFVIEETQTELQTSQEEANDDEINHAHLEFNDAVKQSSRSHDDHVTGDKSGSQICSLLQEFEGGVKTQFIGALLDMFEKQRQRNNEIIGELRHLVELEIERKKSLENASNSLVSHIQSLIQMQQQQ